MGEMTIESEGRWWGCRYEDVDDLLFYPQAEKMMQFSAPIIIINPVSRKNLNSSIRFFWDNLGLFKYISKSFKSPPFNTKCLPKSQSISYPTQSVHGASSENAALKKQSH